MKKGRDGVKKRISKPLRLVIMINLKRRIRGLFCIFTAIMLTAISAYGPSTSTYDDKSQDDGSQEYKLYTDLVYVCMAVYPDNWHYWVNQRKEDFEEVFFFEKTFMDPNVLLLIRKNMQDINLEQYADEQFAKFGNGKTDFEVTKDDKAENRVSFDGMFKTDEGDKALVKHAYFKDLIFPLQSRMYGAEIDSYEDEVESMMDSFPARSP